MAYKFDNKVKEVKEFSDNNWFSYGVHKVKIGMIEHGFTESGKEFVEFTVIGENEEEDTARVWFTTQKAANYSFNICRSIYVHNAPKDKKDAARDQFDALEDADAMVRLMNEKLIGKECWFTKYQSPDRTYEAADGSVRRSVDKNVYGYEPKLRPELIPDAQQEITSDNIDKVFPEGKKDSSANIPSEW